MNTEAQLIPPTPPFPPPHAGAGSQWSSVLRLRRGSWREAIRLGLRSTLPGSAPTPAWGLPGPADPGLQPPARGASSGLCRSLALQPFPLRGPCPGASPQVGPNGRGRPETTRALTLEAGSVTSPREESVGTPESASLGPRRPHLGGPAALQAVCSPPLRTPRRSEHQECPPHSLMPWGLEARTCGGLHTCLSRLCHLARTTLS